MNVKHEGKIVEISEGMSGRDFADHLNLREPHQALALILNGKVCDLSSPLRGGDEVAFGISHAQNIGVLSCDLNDLVIKANGNGAGHLGNHGVLRWRRCDEDSMGAGGRRQNESSPH